MKPSHKIVFNTGVLYGQLVIVMVINLINVRLLLMALGEVDYGIFILVAGSVNMLALLKSAMTSASMRFMAHSFGTKNDLIIYQTFNTTIVLHVVLGIATFIIIELGGLFLFEYVLNIPAKKVSDAKILFHFMALTTLIMIVSIPYDAVINAHENLLLLSIVDVIGALFKLGVAIYLLYSDLNLLLIYGFSLLAIQIIMRLIKQVYSTNRYVECRLNIRKYFDKKLVRKIFSFSLWNLLGSISAMSVKEFTNILLNMFFGVRLNSAYGISKQVSNQLSLVSSSMTRALNPQLVKSEGGGNRKRVIDLTEKATKYSSFLFAFFAIPVIINMPYILSVWLKDVPEYTVIFSRLILISLLIQKFSFEITNAIRAVGKIKEFQIIETIISILQIPIAYILLAFDYPPYIIFYSSIGITVIMFIERLFYGRKIVDLDIVDFLIRAIRPILVPIILSSLVSIWLYSTLSYGFLTFIIITTQSMSMMLIYFWKVSLTQEEINKVKEIIQTILSYFKQ